MHEQILYQFYKVVCNKQYHTGHLIAFISITIFIKYNIKNHLNKLLKSDLK